MLENDSFGLAYIRQQAYTLTQLLLFYLPVVPDVNSIVAAL